MNSRQAAARDAALAMVTQVEHQALDIAGDYRDGAGIGDRFSDFQAFIGKIGQFQVFVDLVEDHLSDLEPEKRERQAQNLTEIRWRILLLEIVAVQTFLDRMAASGKPWPLGSHGFLERRLKRLDEIVAFHQSCASRYGLVPPDASLLQAVREALRQQLGRSLALQDFTAPGAQPAGFMPAAFDAPLRRPAPKPEEKPASKPETPAISAAALTLPVQTGQGGENYYLQDSANSVVSEACRAARISLDELATRLNISRSGLVLMLTGSDQITRASLNHLRAFVRQHLTADAA